MKLTRTQRAISASLAVTFALCFLLATEHRAYAYIDPGSGLLALQSALASLAAAGYFLRRRIASLFGRKSVETPQTVVAAREDDTRSAA